MASEESIRPVIFSRRVAKLIGNLRARVNLIPWNPGKLPYRPPDAERIEAFRKALVDKGQHAFVRHAARV